jgi:glycosyltransferase involved in cell wall biosynthesis
MKQNHLLVSIIVPMYNAERFISATLESILHEKTTSIEVIVVNDKSTDHSLDRVREFNDERIRVIEGLGRGIASALNIGLANARGSIIMECDSDDLYPPARISRQVQWLESHPEYGAVCGSFSTIDSEGNPIADMQCGDSPAEISNELINGKIRTHFCTYAIRSSLAQKVGGFREFFKTCPDIDIQLRLGEAIRIAYVPENWYYYRVHQSSITHTAPNSARVYFERTAFEMQRQRLTSGLDDLQRGRVLADPKIDQPEPYSTTDHIQGQLLGRAWREHTAGKKMSALRTGIRALAANPTKINVWKSIFTLVLRPTGKAAP